MASAKGSLFESDADSVGRGTGLTKGIQQKIEFEVPSELFHWLRINYGASERT